MKLSYNWLRQYIDLTLSPEDLSEILTDLGLEVEGLETIESIPGGLNGLIIGEVLTCVKHSNADKLSLTTVDVGGEEPIQIVCGAPNVATGQKVVVATVGTMLYPTVGDPFKIKKGKIRGEVSEGMICAEDEIGIGSDHDGIIVLSSEVAVGIPAADHYKPGIDYVYEIGLTPNRSDATSHIGVARDLGAYFTYHDQSRKKIKDPQIIDLEKEGIQHISVEVRDKEGCPRFSGVSLSGIKIGPSPEWMQENLRAIGVRPISNIVDITNYVLHEMGQPLHAYDQTKIQGSKIIVDTLPEGSLFQSLDEKERKLSGYDLAICDGEMNAIGLAGVFGGVGTGVENETTDIFLEAAHFNALRIRKTSTKHNLRTDAAKCFEKGSDPNITVVALARAAALMVEYADATVSSGVIDIYPIRITPLHVEVDLKQVNKLLGTKLDEKEVMQIFDALSMEVVSHSGDDFVVAIPTNKADVTREADVIEEILRIYGFNNIEVDNRIHTAVTPSQGVSKSMLRSALSALMVGEGYHEMMGMSLIPSAHYKDTSYKEQLVQINNTSNIHLDVMRPEMMMSGLLTVAHNLNRQQGDLSLYEFGRSYIKEEEGYQEEEFLTVFAVGKKNADSWLQDAEQISFYTIKRIALRVFARLGLSSYQISELEDERFTYGLKFHRGPKVLASFGMTSTSYKKITGVKDDVFYGEFSLDAILKAVRKTKVTTQAIPKYPSSRRDLALVVSNEVKYADIEAIIKKSGSKLLTSVNLFDVYQDDKILGEGLKSYAVSMNFVDLEKSLKDKQLDKIINKMLSELASKVDAKLRK